MLLTMTMEGISQSHIVSRTMLRKFSTETAKLRLPMFRVVILGAKGTGKTALVVRFLTQRFIGEYDSTSERVYHKKFSVGTECVSFDVLDTITKEEKSDVDLRDQIHWADAFILMYSITDPCSFQEIDRLKFLIDYSKRNKSQVCSGSVVALVGSKTDIFGERMITWNDGLVCCGNTGCDFFREISVRESVDQCQDLFTDLYSTWQRKRSITKTPKLLEPSKGLFGFSLHSLRSSSGERSRSSSPSLPRKTTGGMSPRLSPRFGRSSPSPR